MHVDRRKLLGLGAGALLAPVLPAAPARVRTSSEVASAPEKRPARTRKAVKLEMVGGQLTLREKLQLLADLGFDGVELPSPNELDPDDVLEARDKSGLAIAGVVDSVHWSQPLGHPDPEVRRRGREGLEQAIRDARLYGGPHVLLVPAVVNEGQPYDLVWRRSQEEIRRVLPLAHELSVRIAFENVWNNFLLSPLEAARYVDSFPSPQVSWFFDVGNIVLYGWPEQWIRILGARISRVDVKEYSRAKAREQGLWAGFDVELLEGDCNWPAVTEALDEVGFEGWLVAEVPGGGRERLADVAARMDRIVALRRR